MKNYFNIFILILLYSNFTYLAKTENINLCIKNAVDQNVKLNKILTLCRDNINSIEIYSNDYTKKDIEITSDYISTNRTEKN